MSQFLYFSFQEKAMEGVTLGQNHGGSCLCGEVQFSFVGKPRFVAECVCESCREAHGASAVAWVLFGLVLAVTLLNWKRGGKNLSV